MWINRTGDFDLADSKIVKRDFIIAEGSTSNYSFLNKTNTFFERDISVPVFHIFKVHKNHPLRIISLGANHINIFPIINNQDKRMPTEIIRDRMDYDLTTFMLVPFDINFDGHITTWEKFPVEQGFFYGNDKIQDASLLYCEHGITAGQKSLQKISEVMPSQVINHFYSWLHKGGKIVSHDKTFNQTLEGRIEIQKEKAREITWEVSNILEERYNTRLMHGDYKRYWEDLEKG